jgi:hypothetical protein
VNPATGSVVEVTLTERSAMVADRALEPSAAARADRGCRGARTWQTVALSAVEKPAGSGTPAAPNCASRYKLKRVLVLSQQALGFQRQIGQQPCTVQGTVRAPTLG